MSDLAPKIARIICARAMGGFCKYVGGDLGCKVGRGTSDHTQCIATINQLAISGMLSTAEEIESLIEADDTKFIGDYAKAYNHLNMEDVARLLSGRLRQMDKRAAAANKRADAAEAALKETKQCS